MKLLGARWTARVNFLQVRCDCGKEFEHRADRWHIKCPVCVRNTTINSVRNQPLIVRDAVEDEIEFIQRTRPLVKSFMDVVKRGREGTLEACLMFQCVNPKCHRVRFSDDGVERPCRKCGKAMDPVRTLTMTAEQAREKLRATHKDLTL